MVVLGPTTVFYIDNDLRLDPNRSVQFETGDRRLFRLNGLDPAHHLCASPHVEAGADTAGVFSTFARSKLPKPP